MIDSLGAGRVWLRRPFRPSHLVGVTVLIYLMDGCALTYGTVFHTGGTNASFVLGPLAALAFGLAAYPLVRRRRFGPHEATAMLVVQMLAIGFMSHGTHIDLAALGDGLVLPLLGAYASWLLERPATVVFYLGLAVWVVAIAARGDRYLTAVGLMLAIQATLTTEIVRAMRRNVRRLTDTDPLTGILNRRALERTAGQLLERRRRQGGVMTVALIDLDNLREVNNSAGHLAGDTLLVQAAQEWRNGLGDTITPGRIGGDEFVLLFDETDEADARRLLAGMKATSTVRWTAGVAEVRSGESLIQALSRADADMYQHKAARRQDRASMVSLTPAPGA